MRQRASVAVMAAALIVLGAAALAGEAELPIVYQEDFEKGEPLKQWEPMDPAAWKIAEKVRSPHNFGLIRHAVVRNFVLDLKMQSKTKDYGHRDLCLFFGYQNPTRFYYVHMALKADNNAHTVMIVNGKPRTTLIKTIGKDIGGEVFRTKGVVWGDGWHHVRLVREADTGLIEVYFDDMTQPIMRVKDKTFAWGRVGVGSFDDIGNYDDIVLRGVELRLGEK